MRNGKNMEIKKYTILIKFAILLITAAVLFSACEEEPTPVLWDEYQNAGSEIPVIESVQPDLATYALIDTITINGRYFTNDTAGVKVYFNSMIAKIVSLTDTQIKVRTPNLISDSIMIKIVKRTADKFISYNYQLKRGVGSFYGFLKEEGPKAIAVGKDGNIYVSLLVGGLAGGIKKIDINTLEMTTYAPKGNETNWSGMKFAGTQLYAAKTNRGIWKIDAGVAPPNAPWSGPSQGVDANVLDLDFSQDGMMWAAGVHIYRIIPATQMAKKFALTGANLKSVRVFQNYLYVGGTIGGTEGVWRYQILSADDLGPQEEYYNLTSNFPLAKVSAITFDAEGRLYVGTDNVDPVIIVGADRTAQTLYPQSLSPKAGWFAWPEGEFMLYTKDTTPTDATAFIVKVYTGVTSAPYYGLNL
jgi:hypothetical protein